MATFTKEANIYYLTKRLENSEISNYLDLTIITGINAKGKPVMAIWKGKQSRPYCHYYYPNEEALLKRGLEEMKRADKRKEEKEKAIEAKKSAKVIGHGYEVGDIFYDSWGYEQTNIDFYEITRVSKASVWIREIASKQVECTGWLQGKVVACKGEFIGEEVRKTVQFASWNDGKPYIKSRHGWISKWDEKPISYTAYH